jgi:hypothetical protein
LPPGIVSAESRLALRSTEIQPACSKQFCGSQLEPPYPRSIVDDFLETGYCKRESQLVSRTARETLKKFPTRIVEKSILGMLPHTKLGRSMGKKLFVYEGSEHKHEAQKPERLEV